MRSWGWGPHDGITALILRGTRELACSLSFSLTFTSHHVRTQQRGNHCKPGREFSPESSHAGALILDFQPSQLWENKSLLLKPPSLWHFVTAARAKTVLHSASRNYFFHHFTAKFLESVSVYKACLHCPLITPLQSGFLHFTSPKNLSVKLPITSILLHPVDSFCLSQVYLTTPSSPGFYEATLS